MSFALAAHLVNLLLGSVNFGNDRRKLSLNGLDLLDDYDLLLGEDGHLCSVLLELPRML